MDDENKLKYANDLIVSCMLPELVNEIGQSYLESAYFDTFRKVVDHQLVQLFDFIQRHEDLIFTTESDTFEIRCNFIILLCELTSPNTLYQTSNQAFLIHLYELVERFFTKLLDEDSKIERNVFTYYKERLKSDKWKKQLGATHGFVKFLQVQYSRAEVKLPSDECTFVLSVGLLLREFYQPVYKELSFEIFNILLKSAKRDFIKSVNIHNVIFDAVFMDVTKIDTGEGTKNLWECLLKCVDLTDNLDFSKWNKVDDLIEAAITRISFALNGDVRYISFIFLAKLCVNFSINKEEIVPYLEEEKLQVFIDDGKRSRNLCTNITSYTSYRWAKKFLKLFVVESYHILEGTHKFSYRILSAIYICYLVLILPIPLYVLYPHIIEFWNKFAPVLMEILRNSTAREELKMMVKEFIQTFLYQMENYQGENTDIAVYQKALQKILEHNFLLDNNFENKTS